LVSIEIDYLEFFFLDNIFENAWQSISLCIEKGDIVEEESTSIEPNAFSEFSLEKLNILSVSSCEFGQHLLIGTEQGEIVIFNTQSGKCINHFCPTVEKAPVVKLSAISFLNRAIFIAALTKVPILSVKAIESLNSNNQLFLDTPSQTINIPYKLSLSFFIIPFFGTKDIKIQEVLLICDLLHVKSLDNEYPYIGDVNFTLSVPFAYPPHIFLSLSISQSLKVFKV
jgi:hypothetical protein